VEVVDAEVDEVAWPGMSRTPIWLTVGELMAAAIIVLVGMLRSGGAF